MSTLLVAAILNLQDSFKAGEPQRVGDASVREVWLSSPEVRRGDWAFATVFFTPGSALVCEPRGVVRRLSLRDLRPEAEGRLPATVKSYALSASGLLALTSEEEIVLLHATRLEALNSFKAPRAGVLASSPALDMAFVGSGRGSLETIELNRGEAVRRHDPERVRNDFDRRIKKPQGQLVRFGDFAGTVLCSPDGRYLTCGSSGASRFAISGYDLLHEEIGKIGTAQHTQPRISADSKYFCVPGDSFGASMVVSLTDFQSPAAVIAQDHELTDLDVAGDRVFGLGRPKGETFEVGQFDFRGERRSVVALRTRSYPLSTRLFVSHDGRHAAVPINNGLYWLEWK